MLAMIISWLLFFVAGYFTAYLVQQINRHLRSTNQSLFAHTINALDTNLNQKAREMTRGRMTVLHQPTDAELAYRHTLDLSKDRGGIPDNELPK